MTVTLYELAGADPALRFSPYCWRIRLALAHKGIAAERVAWRFTEKERIAFSGGTRVPVLVDGATVVTDSWRIVEYLDATYPHAPLLPRDAAGRGHVLFINAWVDAILHGAIARCVLKDIHDLLAPVDVDYFRQSRERAMGRTLEEVVADRATTGVAAFRAALAPVRTVLRQQMWLGGETPDYADYILLGSLQWARCVSRFELIAGDDPVAAWHRRGLALFDGLLENAPRAG